MPAPYSSDVRNTCEAEGGGKAGGEHRTLCLRHLDFPCMHADADTYPREEAP